MLLMVAPLWFGALIASYPNSIVVVALSLFPISAPVVMAVRSGVTEIPAWQVAFGLILLVLAIVGGLLLAARLFRTYLLMYGRRPRLGEVIRSLRR